VFSIRSLHQSAHAVRILERDIDAVVDQRSHGLKVSNGGSNKQSQLC
jgi:hypothetical protein